MGCIVVLGMHRSGTSCLTGVMQLFGVALGDVFTSNPYNKKGNRENAQIMELNDSVLDHNGGAWDKPVEVTKWTQEHRKRRDEIIEKISGSNEKWGFKDPRTILTFDFWMEGLDSPRFIATMRHPLRTAHSLQKRNPRLTLKWGMNLWKAYNDKLIKIIKEHKLPLLDFDMPGELYLEDATNKLIGLGLDASKKDSAADFFSSTLRTQGRIDTSSAHLPRDIEETYYELKAYHKNQTQPKPKLSVIVIFHNMRREAARTLYSLTTKYQRDVAVDDYEVIAIDSNSTKPLEKESVESMQANYCYYYIKSDNPSPCKALNLAAKLANGEILVNLIDGARILSPGILSNVLRANLLFDYPFVTTIGMHLGQELQNESILKGYNQETEDRLLDSFNWKEDGYQLFDHSCIAKSAKGFFGLSNESNCFSIAKDKFLQIGGFDEKFVSPGGGYVNLDVYRKLMLDPGVKPVILLGEATFHQFHGGVATNVSLKKHPWKKFAAEYKSIRGEDYTFARKPYNSRYFMGEVHPSAEPFLVDQEEEIPKEDPKASKSFIQALWNWKLG